MGLLDQTQNLLGGSLAAQQMPAPQPMAPQPQQVPMMMFDPSAAYANRNTVLGADDRQAKLGQAFDGLLSSVVEGNNKAKQNDFSGSKIFAGAASALGGLMGGGYAQGGLQILKDTESKIQDARIERKLQQQEALKGLTSLSSIVNATSPNSQKKLAAEVNAGLKTNDQALRQDSIAARREKQTDYKAIAEAKLKSAERHNKTMEQLKAAGLQFGYDKLQAYTQLENAKRAAAIQMMQFEEAQKNGRFTQEMALKKAVLETNIQRWQAEQSRFAGEFDAEMETKLGERDKDGNLKYRGTTVPKLSGTVGADFDLSGLDENEKVMAETNAMLDKMQPQPVQAPQAPAAVSQMASAPPPPEPAVANMVKVYKSLSGSPEQKVKAKQQFIQALQSRAGMSPAQAVAFMRARGID